jgi:antitoxin component YwqK of YwqJK toxin-antitoxin module
MNYTDDLITGKLKRWYQDGSIMYETEFENGSGVDKAYYENERIKHREIYTDGKKDGLWTYWYKNGQKELEINYKDGKEDGLETQWYENGQKRLEGTHKDGKKDGISRAWNKNGVLLYKIFYNNGEWNKKDIRTFPHEGDPDYVLSVNVQECIKEKDSIIKKFNKSFYKELIGIDNASKK